MSTLTMSTEDRQFYTWWRRLALMGGVISIAIGLILMIWPQATLTVVAIMLGLWLLLGGVIQIAQAAFMPEGRSAGGRVLLALSGIVLIMLGVVCMRNPANSLVLIGLMIGIGLLFAAIAQIFTGFSKQVHGWHRVAVLVMGVLTLIAAIVVLVWPHPTLAVLVWITGLWFLALGLVQLFLAWRAKPGTI